MLSKRALIIIVLFSLGCLHALIFGFLEYPTNFLTVGLPDELEKTQTITLYLTAVIVACFSYKASKKIGLKKVLIVGLILYFWGMVLFSSTEFFSKGSLALWAIIHIATFLFGGAFSSVVVALTTYIILELPKHVGIGVTILFAFMNLGAMLSPILLNFFTGWDTGWVLTGIISILIFMGIWCVHAIFEDPPFPSHIEHLRKGTLIWKEMHYRFAFFILAIILYGMIENTFNLWGEQHLLKWISPKLANETIAVFWLFLIIGQLLALLPLQFFRVSRVFYGLVTVMILSLIMMPLQKHLPGFIAFLALGGAGCSACFPILLAMLEMEIKEVATELPEQALTPLLEIGVAMMFGGYILGVGTVGTRVDFSSLKTLTEKQISFNFYIAAGLGVLLFLLTLYLAKSFGKKITSKF